MQYLLVLKFIKMILIYIIYKQFFRAIIKYR